MLGAAQICPLGGVEVSLSPRVVPWVEEGNGDRWGRGLFVLSRWFYVLSGEGSRGKQGRQLLQQGLVMGPWLEWAGGTQGRGWDAPRALPPSSGLVAPWLPGDKAGLCSQQRLWCAVDPPASLLSLLCPSCFVLPTPRRRAPLPKQTSGGRDLQLK